MNGISEAAVLKAILQYLRVIGIIHWRINTGAAKYKTSTGTERFVRYGHPGMSDILGLLPDGRFLAIEVKAPKGKPTAAQLEFIDGVNKSGGVAFVARSIDDVMAKLRPLSR